MQLLQLDDMVEFAGDKRVRKKMFFSDDIVSELVCYEPGQDTVPHRHPRQDEIFFVVDGEGTIVVGGEDIPSRKGTSVFVPANIEHSIRADRNSRLVILFFKGPGTGGRRKPG